MRGKCLHHKGSLRKVIKLPPIVVDICEALHLLIFLMRQNRESARFFIIATRLMPVTKLGPNLVKIDTGKRIMQWVISSLFRLWFASQFEL